MLLPGWNDYKEDENWIRRKIERGGGGGRGRGVINRLMGTGQKTGRKNKE